MPQQVNIAGVGIVEFPDGMSQFDMGKAIETELMPGITTGKIRPAVGPGFSLTPAGSDQDKAPAPPSIASDVARSGAVGILKGANALAGTLGDARDLSDAATSAAAKALGLNDVLEVGKIALKKFLPSLAAARAAIPTTSDIQWAEEKALGAPLPQPETTAGRYAESIGAMVPATLIGPGTALQKGAAAALGGGASEGLGQLARGTALEGPARIGGAIVGSQLPFLAGTPTRLLRHSLEGATRGDVGAATSLMLEAHDRGVPLTWDEAIQHVSDGRTRLTDLRRVAENSPGGAPLKEIMADRPNAVRAAGDVTIRELRNPETPVPTPAQAGLAAQRAAEGAIGEQIGAVNAFTRPDYAAAEPVRIPAQDFARLQSEPLFARVLREVRADPALNRGVAGLPDDSIGVLNLVKQRMDEQIANARVPGQASSSNIAAANIGEARNAAVAAADAVSPEYARARAAQSAMRRDYVEPLTSGPVGAISRTDDVLAQGEALLPRDPAANAAAASADAVRRLARQNPAAAEDLVHARVQSVFDQATRDLQTGPSPWGGAKFANMLAGNDEAARNLQSVVEALPNGAERWRGLSAFLDNLRATGRAPAQGSATAFNQEAQGALQGGAPAAWVRPLTQIAEGAGRLQARLNARQIARILTDPEAGPYLRQLAGGQGALTDRIVAMDRLWTIARVAGAETQPKGSGNAAR